MSKLFPNTAGTHIGANLAGWHVGQPIGWVQPRLDVGEAARSDAVPRPIVERLESGEVNPQVVPHLGSEAFFVASAVEEVAALQQQPGEQVA